MNKEIILIGSGPSARMFFARLQEIRPEIDTFGLGFQLRFYKELGFFPNYWAFTDRKVVASQWSELRKMLEKSPPSMAAFLPIEAKTDINRKVEWVSHSSTGTFALKKIQELGYETVYLIGIEGQYEEQIPEAELLGDKQRNKLEESVGLESHEIVLQIAVQPVVNLNYFSDNYQRVGDVYSKPLSHIHKTGIQKEVDKLISKGVSVLNLSPISSIRTVQNSPLKIIFKITDSSKQMLPDSQPFSPKYLESKRNSGPRDSRGVSIVNAIDRVDSNLREKHPKLHEFFRRFWLLRKVLDELKKMLIG